MNNTLEIYENYDDGLSISFKKAGRFIKRNIKSASKDIKKVATLPNLITAISTAAMFIPGGQAVAAGTKVAKLGTLAKLGNLAKGASDLLQTPLGQVVMSKIAAKQPLTQPDTIFIDKVAVAQDVDKTTPNVLGAAEFAALTNGSQKQADQPQFVLPPEVSKALANANPEVSGKAANPKEAMSTQNIMLIGGGVVAAVVIAYLVIKK